jgi:group I intron endonuclease
MIGIYKITNPNGRVYVGASKDIDKRWSVDYKYACNVKSQKKLYRSFNKYGIDAHVFEVVEECDVDILFEREIFWIEYYNSFEKGLNLTKGGENPPIQNKPKSAEHIQKIRKSRLERGYKHSEETIENIRKAIIGIKQSDETIEKRVSQFRGKESKMKGRKRPNISEKLKGKFSPISIKCTLIDLETGEIISANSIQELSRKSKISVSSILKIRKGEFVKKYKNYKYE